MHGAAVRLAHLAGDKQVGHNELVDVQLAAEGAQGLDAPVTVDLGNVQEPGDEIPGQHHGPELTVLKIVAMMQRRKTIVMMQQRKTMMLIQQRKTMMMI